MPKIISRKDAKALGHKYYFTGKPCPHGHKTLRFVSSMTCVKCHKKKPKGNKVYYHPFCAIWKAAKASKDRASFLADYPGECSGSRKRGIMNAICSHMPQSKTAAKWTFCKVYNLAQKYSTQKDFVKRHSGAVSFAVKNGLWPAISSHMDRLNSNYDAIYIWGFADGSDLLCKFGVTSQRLGTDRIESVSRKSGLPCEFVILAKSNQALDAERSLKEIGSSTDLSGFNGATEFRRLRPDELTQAYGVVYEHASR